MTNETKVFIEAMEKLILKAKGKHGVLAMIGEEGDTGARANAKRFKAEIEEAEKALEAYRNGLDKS